MGICIGCGLGKRDSVLSNGVCPRCIVHGPPEGCKYTAAELDLIAKGTSDDEDTQVIAPPSAVITQKAALGDAIVLTTSIDVPGREIDGVVSIVASEVAIGMGIFRDIANNWRDFVGGRANSAQKSLREARAACLDELKREAATLGADAVIAVDLDYNELSTAGTGGILFVAATGTAVRLKPSPAI